MHKKQLVRLHPSSKCLWIQLLREIKYFIIFKAIETVKMTQKSQSSMDVLRRSVIL